MDAAKLTLLAAVCILIGCQSIERDAPPLGFADSVGPPPSSVYPVSPPVSMEGPAIRPEGAVGPDVRPVSHLAQIREVEPIVPLPEEVQVDAGLTLPELEEMALMANPAIALAQAKVDAARGRWVQVGLPPNTVLGYSGQQLGSHGLAEQQGLYLQQEFVRGGKLHLNRAVAAEEIALAEQELATFQQRVMTDVRLGFYDVLVAQRRIEVTEQLLEIANQGMTTAEALFNAKEVSQVDVMRGRIELQRSELQHKNAKNLHAAAWSRLSAVLGGTPLAPLRLVGDLEATVAGLDVEQVLQRLIAESPEMAVAMTNVARARWAIDRAYAEPVPNVDVQAVIQRDNGTGGSNANLQVSLPIPWLDRNQGGIREAEADLFAAEQAVGRLELGLKQRLASVFQQYATARNRVHDYSKPEGILAHSKTTLDFVRAGYQAGEIGYLDLLNAQRTYSQTNLAYVEALGDLWSSTVEIDGLLLKDSLLSR